jgi:hypothetical protein
MDLFGQLINAGSLIVNGETLIGCAVMVRYEDLKAQPTLPMYKNVVIIPAAELEQLRKAGEVMAKIISTAADADVSEWPTDDELATAVGEWRKLNSRAETT